jgi:hypothetical protein
MPKLEGSGAEGRNPASPHSCGRPRTPQYRSLNVTPMATRAEEIKHLVKEQAKDEGLWFVADTCAEAYLQQELRKLHALIEGVKTEEMALRVLDGQI